MVASAQRVSRASAFVLLDLGHLGQTGEVAATFEGGGQEQVDDRQRELVAKNSGSERQDVGVVVGPRQAGRPFVKTQSRPGTVHLVGRHGLALAAAPEDDADIGVSSHHVAGHSGTVKRVVHRILGMGTEVVDRLSLPVQVIYHNEL